MYKPIAEYGIIGNCRSSALVSDEGSIDWACLPDFDSGAYFCSILDDEKGGFFKISPTGFYQTNQKYIGNTNILETFFFNQNGSVSLTDFMPVSRKDEEENSIPEFGTKFLRNIKSLNGNHNIELKIMITPDFCRQNTEITKLNDRIIIDDKNYSLVLFTDTTGAKITENTITMNFSLKEDEERSFVLGFYKKGEIKDVHKNEFRNLYKETHDFWNWWTGLCQYTGPFYKDIIRSALALKLLIYSPTGAIIAAPTTSLPEKIGGKFNWDYRYTWLRDASFTMYALLGLGYLKEADDFMTWLEKACTSESSLMTIMYNIHGGTNLKENHLNHLKGYKSSKPVRIGNKAFNQKQFDIFGELLTAINIYVESGGKLSEKMKIFVKDLVNYCCNHWMEKDSGIWERREGEEHHVYSKLMCWAGIDVGIKLAETLDMEVDLKKWETTKDKIKAEILKKGYNKKIKSFVAYYDSAAIDTSTLNIPILGFLPPDDERVINTVENVMKKLVIDWFVMRTYDEKNRLIEGEGAFFLSTFWLIDSLILLGRTKEAKIWIDKIIHYSSPLGLYAEEFDPYSKDHLGNYPQAFTHLGLINSVLNLKQAEAFGYEYQKTTPAVRLQKILSAVFDKDKTIYSAEETIKELIDMFLPYSIKSRISKSFKRRTRRRIDKEILKYKIN